jgi:hypothetical protein
MTALAPKAMPVILTADAEARCLVARTVGSRDQRWTERPIHESRDDPSPFVDIELHQAFLSHFQQEGLASFLIHDISALHDLVDFQRLLAKRAQNILSIIQHDQIL